MLRTSEIFVRLLMKAGLDRDTALIVLGFSARTYRLTWDNPYDFGNPTVGDRRLVA